MVQSRRRDVDGFGDEDTGFGPQTFLLALTIIFVCCCVGSLLYLRRRKRAALKTATLPVFHKPGHHRSLTITSTPATMRADSVLVYDEKMNLIANASAPPHYPIPEIHVTFPEEDGGLGENKTCRVVVLRISETGSVGMEPLHHDSLPPYQGSDAERFQSLDLERIGGLREKEPTSQRWT